MTGAAIAPAHLIHGSRSRALSSRKDIEVSNVAEFQPVPRAADLTPHTRAPRIVLYSHDTLGFGHLRRNLLLAAGLKASPLAPEILMVGGMREAGAFELPEGVDCITLPAYAKGSDGQYRPRDLGQALAPLTKLRSDAIKATVTAFAPDLMIVDNVPRGALCELDATLEALRKRGRTRLVLGLRDVIDAPAVVRRQWLRQRNFEAVRRFYEAIWIYGDPALYDLTEEYGLGGAFGGREQFVGYLDPSVRLASPLAATERDAVLRGSRAPYVLCMVGGGRDGAALCEAFARAPLPPDHRGILITGTQMPAPLRQRVQALAAGRSDLTVLPFVREPIGLVAGAARIVGMGGYNTVCELLALGRPSLVVPRARPRAEQVLRAERLAARGLVATLHPDALSPAALGNWLAGDVPSARGGRPDMGGVERVRAIAEAMLASAPAPFARAAAG